VTTLKLVVTEVPIPTGNYAAVGPNYWNNFAIGMEIADLSVDCNMAAHPFGDPYSTLAKAGIALTGSHHRVRRVHIYNFGTQTLEAECFALHLPFSLPPFPEWVNSVIDECIIERPSRNNVRETTLLNLSGGSSAYHRACGIRNCVVDNRFDGGHSSLFLLAVSLEKLTDVDHHYRLLLAVPHNRQIGDCATFHTVYRKEEYLPSSALNGTFTAASGTTLDTIVFNVASDPNEIGEPLFSSANFSWADAVVDGVIDVTNVERIGTRQYRITTAVPHGHTPSTQFSVSGIKYLVVTYPVSQAFTGSFKIDGVSELAIDFMVPLNPDELPNPEPAFSPSIFLPIQLGTSFNGPTVDGGTGAFAQGNRLFNLTNGNNHDTWSSKDALYLYNYYSNTVNGVSQSLGGPIGGFDPFPSQGSVIGHDGNLAIFTSLSAHELNENDSVAVANALLPSGGGLTTSNPYNQSTTVHTKVDDYTFKYTATGLAATQPNARSAPLFRKSDISDDSQRKAAVSLVRDPSLNTIAVFTCEVEHNLTATDMVVISGAFTLDSTTGAFTA